MATRIYDFTLGASVGASQQIPVNGSVLTVLSASPSTSKVRITIETGESWDCYPGQGFRMPDGKQFAWVLISNLSAVAMTGTVVIGDAGWIDNRVTGNVAVIDNSVDKTKSLASFTGYANTTASVGNYSLSGIYTSSKQIAVRAIVVTLSSAGAFYLIYGTGQGTGNPTIAAMRNRYLGQPNSVSSNYTSGYSASMPPAAGEVPGANTVAGFLAAAGVPFVIPITTPFVVDAGKALIAASAATNVQVLANWEIEELT